MKPYATGAPLGVKDPFGLDIEMGIGLEPPKNVFPDMFGNAEQQEAFYNEVCQAVKAANERMDNLKSEAERLALMATVLAAYGIKSGYKAIAEWIEDFKQVSGKDDEFVSDTLRKIDAANQQDQVARNAFIQNAISSHLAKNPIKDGIEYVVNQALLNCNFSSVQGKSALDLGVLSRLHINDDAHVESKVSPESKEGHINVVASSEPIIHDKDCADVKNITFLFPECTVADYKEKLIQLIDSTSKLEAINTQLQNSPSPQENLDTIMANSKAADKLTIYTSALNCFEQTGKKTCVHAVLDQWFDADEKFQISHYYEKLQMLDAKYNQLIYDVDQKIVKPSNQLASEAKNLCDLVDMTRANSPNALNLLKYIPSRSVREMTEDSEDIYNLTKIFKNKIKQMYDTFCPQIVNYDLVEKNKFIEYIDQFNKNLVAEKSKNWIGKSFDPNKGTNSQIKGQNQIDSIMQKVGYSVSTNFKSEYITLDTIQKYYGNASSFWYNDSIDEITSITAELKSVYNKDRLLALNKSSWLACKVGGKLTILDAGQWFLYAKTKIFPNYQIMIYDIGEKVFGGKKANGEYDDGGIAGLALMEYQRLKAGKPFHESMEPLIGFQATFYSQMRICLPILEKATYGDNSIQVTEPCPVFIKITFEPQSTIENDIIQKNINLGFLSSAIGATGLLATGALGTACFFIGGTLTLLTTLSNFLDKNIGVGDALALTDTGVGGVDKYLASAKNKSLGAFSSGISLVNTVFTFLSTANLLFQYSINDYPGKGEIQFIGQTYSCICTQNYDALGNLIGDLQVDREACTLFDTYKKKMSNETGVFTDNKELNRLYPEISYTTYDDFIGEK